ncbi:hypothetical protein [Candidatus Formimonas warabiya]|uniref:Uncharacterized protein n=1 Tax=Formimonas warabiya TaxID=1761012 RepID=A0A3G1KT49_FORW1|nr:hypothetical protein [Candidatus Formimonas warabiya]ATW25638.1 hypothetical protein DCMF_13480 [Candidatus Formimonas warabiya]
MFSNEYFSKGEHRQIKSKMSRYSDMLKDIVKDSLGVGFSRTISKGNNYDRITIHIDEKLYLKEEIINFINMVMAENECEYKIFTNYGVVIIKDERTLWGLINTNTSYLKQRIQENQVKVFKLNEDITDLLIMTLHGY